jgi:hypothetical protein
MFTHKRLMERFILSRVSETAGIGCLCTAQGVVVYPKGEGEWPRYMFKGGVRVNDPPRRAVIDAAAEVVREAVKDFRRLPQDEKGGRKGPDTIEFCWCEAREQVIRVITRH